MRNALADELSAYAETAPSLMRPSLTTAAARVREWARLRFNFSAALRAVAELRADNAALKGALIDIEAGRHRDAETTRLVVEEMREALLAREADLAAARKVAEDWARAAESVRQPPEFYEKYNESTMNAMQAMLHKAQTDLAAALELLREARTDWVDKDYPLADRIDAALAKEKK